MRYVANLQTLSTVAALALLTACSGGGSSAAAPNLASPQGGAPFFNTRHIVSHYACPAEGPIEYIADDVNSGVIDVYSGGQFTGQPPCGQIVWTFNQQRAFFVDVNTHDLYVANPGDFDVLVFHRGETTPYNTYTDPDPNRQYPGSVVVASDGTVIACNFNAAHGPEHGSLSTWIKGPNGGTFVGNFPMIDYGESGFVAINRHDKVYYNDHANPGGDVLWSVSCPSGRCGHETQIAGVSFRDAFDMAFDAAGDLVVEDTQPGSIETFTLPNPRPATFHVNGFPDGMAINVHGHHLFISDGTNLAPTEYSYPRGTLIGTAQAGRGYGIAFDP